MRISRYFLSMFLLTAVTVFSCDPVQKDPVNEGGGSDNTDQPATPVQDKPSEQISQADQFAVDALGIYYLWSQEIINDLPRLDPDTCKSPINVVREIRYHKAGKEVDHWTMLTDNLGEMTSSVEGTAKSFGYDLTGMWVDKTHTSLVFIVNYVSKGKPAEKAGLQRGDIIWSLNGADITLDNYTDLYYGSSVTLEVQRGLSSNDIVKVSMVANEDWEDPVLLGKTFDVNGKKVGYLVYNSFDVKTMETLPDVFRSFKADGIQELILDLRYNGGGFVITECELASLIAPYSNVSAGDVYQTELYNALLTEAWKDEDFNTYFETKFEYKTDTYDIMEDISDANVDLKKMYVIVTGGSASASEGLIVGLGPYMDITLIGEQTYGKYCAGYMMSPANLYGNQSTTDYSLINKWGIYVMVSQFADKNGNNPAMPDGIPADIEAHDDPFDGYQLGDEDETMLSAALAAAGKPVTKVVSSSRHAFDLEILDHGRPRGILIKSDLPSSLPVNF